MSSRPAVNRDRIEAFLHALGQGFNKPGRIYLVGGTTMVMEGLREQSIDVDLTYQIADENLDEFLRTIRQLEDQPGINVEEASPGDFIPLPRGAYERAIYVGRYGNLDVFHFDLYSTALSKIGRGSEEDFSDIVLLVRSGRIQVDLLERFYSEIRPKLPGARLRLDPLEFEKNMDYMRRLLGEMS